MPRSLNRFQFVSPHESDLEREDLMDVYVGFTNSDGWWSEGLECSLVKYVSAKL